MKSFKWISLLAIGFLSLNAEARLSSGSRCGLADRADEFNMKKEDSLQLTWRSRFNDTEKAQLIQSASIFGAKDVKNALADLIENSEGGEVFYQSGEFGKESFEVVLFYPGGNPMGLIFKKGEKTPRAEIRDSDIICR